MRKYLLPLLASALLLTPLLPATAAHAAPPLLSAPSLTVKEIVRHSDRIVKIYALDADGEEAATGSGFVVSPDGQIVTNFHVIADAATLRIEFANKQTYETDQALLVDPDRDLALIKINATGLPDVTLGDSSRMEVGDSVIAVGSPLGFENTVSDGLISGIRHFEEEDLDYLQTTAPITHGSSGGVLFNMNGEVIGVTTLSYSTGELNFAIPSNDVKKFLSQPHKPQTVAEASEGAEISDNYYDSYGAAAEIEDKLNDEFSFYQNPVTGEKVGLDFYVDPNFDDEEALDIELDLASSSLYTYLLSDLAQQNSQHTADLLAKVLKTARQAGGKKLTATFYQQTNTRKLTAIFPGDYARFDTRTGYYSVSHVFAWAALNDMTGEMTYLIEPGLNDREQHSQLFTK